MPHRSFRRDIVFHHLRLIFCLPHSLVYMLLELWFRSFHMDLFNSNSTPCSSLFSLFHRLCLQFGIDVSVRVYCATLVASWQLLTDSQMPVVAGDMFFPLIPPNSSFLLSLAANWSRWDMSIFKLACFVTELTLLTPLHIMDPVFWFSRLGMSGFRCWILYSLKIANHLECTTLITYNSLGSSKSSYDFHE